MWFAIAGGTAACVSEQSRDEAPESVEEVILGPADGLDLPPTDLERVTAGDVAPDFTAMSLAGETVTLSEFRGDKNVVLVFYRGHW